MPKSFTKVLKNNKEKLRDLNLDEIKKTKPLSEIQKLIFSGNAEPRNIGSDCFQSSRSRENPIIRSDSPKM